MRVRVREIHDNGGFLERRATLSAADLAVSLEGGRLDEMRLTFTAQAVDEEVLAAVQWTARVTLSCSRCVENFAASVNNTVEWRAAATETDLPVLDEVRQSLLLSLPVKPLCQSDCKGLCPRCGRNRNESACACAGPSRQSPFEILRDYGVN